MNTAIIAPSERMEAASKECGNTLRGLTHESTSPIGGLAVNATRNCSFDNCADPVRAKGFCKRHYQQQWRVGSPEIVRPNAHGTPEERFWRQVDKRGPAECWEWMGHLDKDGYGALKVGSDPVRANRFSYELHHAELGELLARHTCDNPPCVNPAHLIPGTHLENMADRKAAGNYVRKQAMPSLFDLTDEPELAAS